MERRKFTREFKLDAVRLIEERGVSYPKASHDLGVHQSLGRHLGQCRDGELLLLTQDRAHSAQNLSDTRRGQG
jgi:transposase-like protein